MTDRTVNDTRDQIIAAVPELAGVVMARDQVVDQWCAEHNKDKNALSIDDILAIRALPAWQKAG